MNHRKLSILIIQTVKNI